MRSTSTTRRRSSPSHGRPRRRSPVLVEVSQGEVDAIGLANLRDLVDNYRAGLGVEMYINLDHSPSVEAAKAGIDAGFEFIHIDLSQAKRDATDDEIVEATREVVAYARTTGALVESEPHYFGGSSNVHTEDIDYEEVRKTFSTPEGARAFVDATGIDTFAAAVGNLHGRYPVPKLLDLELLQRIRDAIGGYISLHGGSGTPGHFFRRPPRSGSARSTSTRTCATRTAPRSSASCATTRTSTRSSASWGGSPGRPGRRRGAHRPVRVRRQGTAVGPRRQHG